MRILVVDDESLNRFLLIHMLEEAGYTDCFEAESGREALQLSEKIKPDLVLLDVVMPDMDGFEVAPRLKKMAGDIYLPIIFITALDDQDSLAKCLEVGGDDFASKPFDKIILTAKIRAHARTRLLSKRASKQNEELNYFRIGVEREHAIVEHIFSNALTINKTVAAYFDYRLAPASSFNGDLFLIEPSPSGGIYFLMGDFTGHGLASAIGALPVARAFQAMANKGLSVSEMASTINKTLMTLLPGDMFFAAVIAEIASNGHQFTVWNGGMPDLTVFTPAGEVTKHFQSQHMALGILEPYEFEENVEYFDANIGDRLIGYSDGVIELTNVAEQMLGEDAVLSWLSESPDLPVADIEEKVEAFRGNAEQLDDITFVSYTCQSLEALRPEYTVTQLPFNIEVDLCVEKLKTIDPIYELVIMVCSQLGMQSIRSDLSTVLSELFNNSLDHGILHLDSTLKKTTEGFFEYFDQRTDRLAKLKEGSIQIRISFTPENKTLSVELEDSGQGFDFQNLGANHDSDAFGRGIPLIKELCESVEYSSNGTKVTATFAV
ncbi:MAG: SpoIIE family protein phosphatase [Aliiglaciecola sp.]